MLDGNREAIEAWNTVLFEKFVRYRDTLVKGLGNHGNRALALFAPQPGWHVVDIGCGFGDTTIDIARRVGPSGSATGIDAAANFLEIARNDAREARVENATFVVQDIEETVPGGPYDMAYSRMGTMFFNQPVFALRNTRKALKPGAKMVMVVWRKKEFNDAMYQPELVVREILGDPPKGDQITCGPGPFSMGSADVVGDQLLAAGFRDPVFARSDATIKVGATVDEAIDFALTVGPSGEVVRLAGDTAVKKMDEIRSAVRAVLEPWLTADGVWAPSSCWIVSATTPS
jgi:ubiquinone/menaquinone biosynthesis C-methylase UbiE